MPPHLVVTDDLVAAACRLFLKAAPQTLVLAGGNTPRPLYTALAALDYPWDTVQVFFSDERCVPHDHPDSNYGMATATLLNHVAATAYPFPTDCDAFGYETALREVFRGEDTPTFDLAFLGLGADGHTASLFPGDAALREAEHWVARVLRSDHPRLTLTLPALAGVDQAVYLVRGADKREAVRRVLAGDDLPPNLVQARHATILAAPDAAP